MVNPLNYPISRSNVEQKPYGILLQILLDTHNRKISIMFFNKIFDV